jgi:hypothetical protein
MREREGLVARIRHIRRVAAAAAPEPATDVNDPNAGRGHSAEARIAHLERLVEGLQDSVHRETARQNQRITELEARLEPAALAVALSKDARKRGL